MLFAIAYNFGTILFITASHLLIIALSYAMVGCGILCNKVRKSFPFRQMESDSESETGSESVSEEGAEHPEASCDLSGNEARLLERENEALQEANAAWFEKVEEMEKQKRHSDQQCSMISGVGLMLFTVYATIIYVHLLKKKGC